MKFSISILILIIVQFIISCIFANTPLQLRYDESDPTDTIDFIGLQKLFRIPKYRLYHSIIPTNYNLRIRPILDNIPDIGDIWTAPGSIEILVDCIYTTNNISLHSAVKSIDLTSVKVTLQSNGEELLNPKLSRDVEKEFLIISFDKLLIANEKYKISINFIAEIFIKNNQMSGLYRSHYIDPNTKIIKYLATTQLQAFGARLVFPCFDEPEFKAIFDITIGRLVSSGYTAISNTPIKGTIIDEEGWAWDTFESTVPMPTYLVAMVISDFTAAIAPIEFYPKPVQTIGPKYLIDLGRGDWTAEIAAKNLAYFEEYFLQEYSLAKMDSAAMIDFQAGAMENWGLNIYREAYLMYSPVENTENERRGMSSVLAHELSHQWFGNLITCKWWIDAWLNEGFASYFQFFGMRNTTGEFEPMKIRLTESFQTAMRSDVLENSHPTRLPDKGSPYETMIYLTGLVYQKGSALIRMMEGFMSEKTLQIGLQKFLKKFAFKPVEQDDLFEVLNEQAEIDGKLPEGGTIKQIMDTWTLQRGYPLVRVSSAGSNRIFISQEKFVNKGHIHEDFTYYIPISVATEDIPDFGTLPEFWIEPSTTFTSREHNTSKWIILNAGATGYYRVLYDSALTNLIVKQLDEMHMSIFYLSRSQLIDDYFTIGFEGYTSITHALSMTKYLGNELEYTVWITTIHHLRKMYNLFGGSSNFITLSNYLLPRINKILRAIGPEQIPLIEKGNIVLFRAQLLDWACGFGHETSVNYAVRLWNEWKASPMENKIPIDLRQIVYCAAIKVGTRIDIDFALERYFAEENVKQKQWIISAFGCTTQRNFVFPLLEESISGTSGISKADAVVLMRSIAANTIIGQSTAMDFLETRVNDIISYMGYANSISGVISTISNYYKTSADLNRIQSFIDKNEEKLTPVMSSLNISIRNIEANIKWISEFQSIILNWFWANT